MSDGVLAVALQRQWRKVESAKREEINNGRQDLVKKIQNDLELDSEYHRVMS